MKPWTIRQYALTWLALLAMLAATLASAYIPMGSLNIVVNLAIAAGKALLVLLVFMHLRGSPALLKLVAMTGFAWLAILAALSLGDFLLRMP